MVIYTNNIFEKTCPYCGRLFFANKLQKYCCNKCQQANARSKKLPLETIKNIEKTKNLIESKEFIKMNDLDKFFGVNKSTIIGLIYKNKPEIKDCYKRIGRTPLIKKDAFSEFLKDNPKYLKKDKSPSKVKINRDKKQQLISLGYIMIRDYSCCFERIGLDVFLDLKLLIKMVDEKNNSSD